MSETPIFDQLAAELGYFRLVANPPKRVPAYTGTSTSVRGAMAPGMYIDEWAGIDTTQGDVKPATYEDLVHAIAAGKQTDETVNAAPTMPIPVTTLAKLAEGTHQE